MVLNREILVLISTCLTFGLSQQNYGQKQTFATSHRRPHNNNIYNPEYFRPNNFAYGTIQNLRSENINNGDGSYNYFYENNDGSSASERGYLKAPRNIDDGAGIQTSEGFYQYYSPEGQLIRVDYIADENGFQPRGDHLPTPSPIPEAIQKSLDLIYAGIERQKLNSYTDQYNPYQGNYNSYTRPVYGPKSYNKRYKK